ncbi:exodeoxyribonuclease III [Malassezia sp. CBS 17886]|nr:exodeoxyribonuclease III [Malassezia sp. CBS 17886]
MELALAGADLKPLIHAVACLYRIGDEAWFTLRSEDGRINLQLAAVNATGSAYGCFLFDETYFERIAILGDAEEAECKLHLRVRAAATSASPQTLLNILRMRGSIVRCTLSLAAMHLDVRLECGQGVTKRHRLPIGDEAGIYPSLDTEPPYTLSVAPQTAREWIDHFLETGKTGECALHCGPTSCVLRSRTEKSASRSSRAVQQAIQSVVVVPMRELSSFHVPRDTVIVFSLWEFRAAVGVAEQLKAPLQLAFGASGDPLFLRFHLGSSVFAEFILATNDGEGDGAGEDGPGKMKAGEGGNAQRRNAGVRGAEAKRQAVAADARGARVHVPQHTHSALPVAAHATGRTPPAAAPARPSRAGTPPTPPLAWDAQTRSRERTESPNECEEVLELPVRRGRPATYEAVSARGASMPPSPRDASTPPSATPTRYASATHAVAPTPRERGGDDDELPSTLFSSAARWGAGGVSSPPWPPQYTTPSPNGTSPPRTRASLAPTGAPPPLTAAPHPSTGTPPAEIPPTQGDDAPRKKFRPLL